jgi:hypothetical protein
MPPTLRIALLQQTDNHYYTFSLASWLPPFFRSGYVPDIDTSLYNCLVSLGILSSFRGCRSGRRVKERNAYLRDQNSTRAQHGHQICISPNQNNTPSYNHPSSCFTDIASLQTSRRREFVPSQVVQPNTRNLNNLILITPNKPENHNLTCADQPIETDSRLYQSTPAL